MKYFLIALTFFSFTIHAQTKKPEDFGFRHYAFVFQKDTVNVLVKSFAGEEQVKKPMLFFAQGSMPQPLIKTDGENMYGAFPFDPTVFLKDFHLVIVSKPFVPLVADVKSLDNNFCIQDTLLLKKYSQKNLPDYYVKRNLFVLKKLEKETWVKTGKLVAAGHSEGSSIAARMAVADKKITHLIYSGGNPYGRILSIIQQARSHDNYGDTLSYGEQEFAYWKEVVANKNEMNFNNGDSHKTTYDFSEPLHDKISLLKIPVLISYGTRDWSAPYNDLMRIEFIRQDKQNIQFKAYPGTEHNYFPLKESGKPDYDQFNWDKVAKDWSDWLKKN